MEEPQYLSYLLRIWPAKTGGKTVWRASLESGLTGDRNGFPDLEALFTFLEQILQEMNPDENVPVEGGKEQNPGGE